MSAPGLVIGRIVIERYLTDDGDDIVQFKANRGSEGEPLPMIEILGMLRLAEDSTLHPPGEDDDNDCWHPPDDDMDDT